MKIVHLLKSVIAGFVFSWCYSALNLTQPTEIFPSETNHPSLTSLWQTLSLSMRFPFHPEFCSLRLRAVCFSFYFHFGLFPHFCRWIVIQRHTLDSWVGTEVFVTLMIAKSVWSTNLSLAWSANCSFTCSASRIWMICNYASLRKWVCLRAIEQSRARKQRREQTSRQTIKQTIKQTSE